MYERDLFDDEDSTYQARLNGQWLSIIALREGIGIASRSSNPPTYKAIFAIAEKLDAELLGRQVLLFRDGESKEVRKYREKARLLSAKKTDDSIVTAIEVVNSEIQELEDLLRTKKEPAYFTQADLEKLYEIRSELEKPEPTSYEEPEVLLRDWNLGIDLPTFKGDDGNNYHDFALPDNRLMRIRFLHPNKADRITGIDLLYEYHEPEHQRARLAGLQYKILESSRKSLSLDSDIQEQLDKLAKVFCKNKYCVEPDNHDNRYRLPCCSAFLRPTDQLQNFNPRLASSGYHIQICDIPKLQEKSSQGNPILTIQTLKRQAISFNIFEELFNKGKLGSRWLSYNELETFHHRYSILKSGQKAAIHIQEVELIRR